MALFFCDYMAVTLRFIVAAQGPGDYWYNSRDSQHSQSPPVCVQLRAGCQVNSTWPMRQAKTRLGTSYPTFRHQHEHRIVIGTPKDSVKTKRTKETDKRSEAFLWWADKNTV